MRQRVGWLMACEKVMGDADLVGLVLSHADLSPRAFVGAGRVSRSWREACRGGPELLMAVARRPGYLTKTVFSGLFGLSREESDAFPHDEVARFPGHVYKYTAIAIESALPWVGGVDGWRVRLKKGQRNKCPWSGRLARTGESCSGSRAPRLRSGGGSCRLLVIFIDMTSVH